MFENSHNSNKHFKLNRRDVRKKVKSILENCPFPSDLVKNAIDVYADNYERMELQIDLLDFSKVEMLDIDDESWNTAHLLEKRKLLKNVNDAEFDKEIFIQMKHLAFLNENQKDFSYTEEMPLPLKKPSKVVKETFSKSRGMEYEMEQSYEFEEETVKQREMELEQQKKKDNEKEKEKMKQKEKQREQEREREHEKRRSEQDDNSRIEKKRLRRNDQLGKEWERDADREHRRERHDRDDRDDRNKRSHNDRGRKMRDRDLNKENEELDSKRHLKDEKPYDNLRAAGREERKYEQRVFNHTEYKSDDKDDYVVTFSFLSRKSTNSEYEKPTAKETEKPQHSQKENQRREQNREHHHRQDNHKESYRRETQEKEHNHYKEGNKENHRRETLNKERQHKESQSRNQDDGVPLIIGRPTQALEEGELTRKPSMKKNATQSKVIFLEEEEIPEDPLSPAQQKRSCQKGERKTEKKVKFVDQKKFDEKDFKSINLSRNFEREPPKTTFSGTLAGILKADKDRRLKDSLNPKTDNEPKFSPLSKPKPTLKKASNTIEIIEDDEEQPVVNRSRERENTNKPVSKSQPIQIPPTEEPQIKPDNKIESPTEKEQGNEKASVQAQTTTTPMQNPAVNPFGMMGPFSLNPDMMKAAFNSFTQYLLTQSMGSMSGIPNAMQSSNPQQANLMNQPMRFFSQGNSVMQNTQNQHNAANFGMFPNMGFSQFPIQPQMFLNRTNPFPLNMSGNPVFNMMQSQVNNQNAQGLKPNSLPFIQVNNENGVEKDGNRTIEDSHEFKMNSSQNSHHNNRRKSRVDDEESLKNSKKSKRNHHIKDRKKSNLFDDRDGFN